MSQKEKITPEPTLHDVMSMLVGMDGRIEEIEKAVVDTQESAKATNSRVARIEKVVIDVQAEVRNSARRISRIEDVLTDVEAEVRETNRSVSIVQSTNEDIKEALEAVADAVDKDAVTVVEHSRRIAILEKVS